MRPLLHPLPDRLEALASIALDLRWSWSHDGDALWRSIDAETWDKIRNPWLLLQDLSRRRIDELAADEAFLRRLDHLENLRREAAGGESTWFAAAGHELSQDAIGYFSMEFGLGEAIPLYAGGLGILAGDHLKTANDLGLPVVSVGILFQEGYFRQSIDAAGRQSETYPYNDPTMLPIQPALEPSGSWLRVSLDLPGRTLWLRVWRASVGRVDLFLLDANEPINLPIDRGITAKLYGGTSEVRLLQELVLGVGGWRALEAVGRAPSVAHLNEGHAAFVILERARQLRARYGLSFQEALWAVRAGNIFTTHTPVAAGFDVFSAEQMAAVFAPHGSFLAELGISFEELLALGRARGGDAGEPFNMAYLALRGCARTNAVSRLHGEVSRGLFAPLFPRWPVHQVPVGHVTNGVHVPTWDSQSADALWTRLLGEGAWRGPLERHETSISKLSDEELWQMRQTEREALVAYARARLSSQLLRRGAATSAAELGDVLDPSVLTLGFARRFAEYKRPHLLLRDPERLARLLGDRGRPVQLLIAGKAHPADEQGKNLIARWLEFVQRRDVRAHAVFLEDYDMALAARLVAGVDVWINTPRRPWEACGTSGMKVLANGGLNVSELDGWWAEAYEPEVGWALGGVGTPDDARDAEELYLLLEREIVPEFYARDAQGLPRRWLTRIRASMGRLAPAFSSTRMAFDYLHDWYAPAARAFLERTADAAVLAKHLAAWERDIGLHWDRVSVCAKQARRSERELEFSAEVRIDGIAPEGVRVELFAEARGEEPLICELMRRVSPAFAGDPLIFSVRVQTARPASDFTPRVVPQHPSAQIPAECGLIAWADASFANAE